MPDSYNFFELHSAIQDAMGWNDSHLHSFTVDQRGKQKSKSASSAGLVQTISLPNPEFDDDVFANDDKDELQEIIGNWFGKVTQQCVYTYDYGDGWDHTVLLEKTLPFAENSKYPQCTGGKNACPPDDCGGIGGYEHLKAVLSDVKHEEHEDMLEWLCLESAVEFDPTNFDPKEVVFTDPKERLEEYEEYAGFN